MPIIENDLKDRYRLAFFDVDGTLLGMNGEYSLRLKKSMRAVQNAGIKTAIASGRPRFATDFLIDDLGLNAAGVFYTGGLVYDPLMNQVLNEHSLSRSDVNNLIDSAKTAGIYTEVYTRDHFYIEEYGDIAKKHAHHLRCAPEQILFDFMDDEEPVIKLLMAVTQRDQHRHLRSLENKNPHLIFAYAHLAEEPDWLFVSIISSAACKKAAFEELLSHHQVTSDQVICFGDAHSDLDFIGLAGTGVAMGNASKEVKLAANIVTLPVWDDGVAHILEQLV